MRVYLPATLDLLEAWSSTGRVPPKVERVRAGSTDEEAEYLALMSAADLSAALGQRRRVVVVAETPEEAGAVPMSDVVAVHADLDDGAAPDDELAWFAAQEIEDLLHGE